jgi:acyl-CoA synthetase (AMP-forming)/AMP-acid ligase II
VRRPSLSHVTPGELLEKLLRRDASRPLVTWYDDATGERVELSVATAANWAAKTANLLSDEDIEAVQLEPASHWLAAVVALGAWAGGVAVVDVDGEPLPGDARTFTQRVLAQPDALLSAPPSPSDAALCLGSREWTLAELGEAAQRAATRHEVGPGSRVLSTLPLDDIDGLDAGLLVPLAADGSVVLVANADETKLARRAADERVTHTAGVDVAGLPRLVSGARGR